MTDASGTNIGAQSRFDGRAPREPGFDDDDVFDVDREAVATYVASLTQELATMARKNDLPVLAYLLDMARIEASSVSGGYASVAAA